MSYALKMSGDREHRSGARAGAAFPFTSTSVMLSSLGIPTDHHDLS
jgi:hypothetical protein